MPGEDMASRPRGAEVRPWAQQTGAGGSAAPASTRQ